MIFLITQLVPGFQWDSFCQSYSVLTLAAGYGGVFLRVGFEASKVHVPLSLSLSPFSPPPLPLSLSALCLRVRM